MQLALHCLTPPPCLTVLTHEINCGHVHLAHGVRRSTDNSSQTAFLFDFVLSVWGWGRIKARATAEPTEAGRHCHTFSSPHPGDQPQRGSCPVLLGIFQPTVVLALLRPDTSRSGCCLAPDKGGKWGHSGPSTIQHLPKARLGSCNWLQLPLHLYHG